MFDCKIEIVTTTEGQTSRFVSEGKCRLEADGALSLDYRQDGDETRLSLSKDRLAMRRSGQIGLCAEFIAGCDSYLETVFDGAKGRIPIHSDQYRFYTMRKGCGALLAYTLKGEGADQPFQLEITIETSEEK